MNCTILQNYPRISSFEWNEEWQNGSDGLDPKSMGPGPGSGFESQTRAHCDSKILYLLSTALFKIYLHMYINGFSVYLKNIYAYLCFLSCAALLYPIYQ